MKCERFEELITEYLDGELEFSEKKDFENHMFKCTKCRELFSQIAENIEILNDFKLADDDAISFEIFQKFHSSFEAEKHKNRVKKDLYKKIITTAAILIIGFLMLRGVVRQGSKTFSTYSIFVNSAQKIAYLKVFSEKSFYKFIELKERAEDFFYKTRDNLDIKYKIVKKYTLSSNNKSLRR